jgi:hypothetical protein
MGVGGVGLEFWRPLCPGTWPPVWVKGGGAILFILLYNVVHFLCQKMPAETKIIKTKMPAETLKQKSIDVIVVALDYSLMHTRAYMLKA